MKWLFERWVKGGWVMFLIFLAFIPVMFLLTFFRAADAVVELVFVVFVVTALCLAAQKRG